jgi:hypothetical protein
MVTIDVAEMVPGGFLGVLGACLVLIGSKMLRIAGRAADTAPSKVRSVAIGFAELAGRAKVRETLTAPLSGRPCTYYACEIERYETSGSGKYRRTGWVRKWHEEHHIGFSLDDGTGSITLKTDQAEFNCAPDKRWYLRPGSRFTIKRWRDHTGTIAELELDAHEIAPAEPGASRIGSYRFTERIIAPDEEIYVLGTVKREDDVFVGRDRRLGPFVISDMKEAVLIKRLRSQAIGSLIVGFILLLLSIAVFASAFGLLE